MADIAGNELEAVDWVWEMVAESEVSFLIALSTWEASPSQPAKAAVVAAYQAVLEAWTRALVEGRRRRSKS